MKGRAVAIKENLRQFERSTDRLIKVVVHQPRGAQVLRYIQSHANEHARAEGLCEQAVRVLSEFVSSRDMGLLVELDKVLSEMATINMVHALPAESMSPCMAVIYGKLVAWVRVSQDILISGKHSADLFEDGGFTATALGAWVPTFNQLRSVQFLKDGKFAHIIGKNLSIGTEFLSNILSGPWQYILCESPPQSEHHSVAQFLTQFAKLLQPAHEAMHKLFGIDAPRLQKLLQEGSEKLMKIADIEPKLTVVRQVLYDGEQGKIWEAALASQAKISFVNNATAVVKSYEEHKKEWAQAESDVQEINTLQTGVGRSDAAVALQCQWHIVKFQHVCAKFILCIDKCDGEFTQIPPDVQACYTSLGNTLQDVLSFMDTSYKEDVDKFAEAQKSDAWGLKQITSDIMESVLREGANQSKDAMTTLLGRCALRLHQMGQGLENQIPAYHDYVNTNFDVPAVKTNILEKSWEKFTGEWSVLQKMYTAVLSFPSFGVGKFEALHAAVAASTQRCLLSSKTFIAVVATCSLILETLPTAPKNDRHDLLEEHIVSVSRSGVTLPATLDSYLNRELKRMKKPGSRKAAAAEAEEAIAAPAAVLAAEAQAGDDLL